QLVPPDSDPGDVRVIDAHELSIADVARVLRTTTSTGRFGTEEGDAVRTSIAGAQEETALLRIKDRWVVPRRATPTTHILKLPLGLIGNLRADMSDSVENEWVCLQILRELGLHVPDAEIACFNDEIGEEKAIVVKRFDREVVNAETSEDPAWI